MHRKTIVVRERSANFLLTATVSSILCSLPPPFHLQVVIATDGGRYDVDLGSRTRTAVYWGEPPSLVRRCSWFYRGEGDRWFMPYREDIAASLEVSRCRHLFRCTRTHVHSVHVLIHNHTYMCTRVQCTRTLYAVHVLIHNHTYMYTVPVLIHNHTYMCTCTVGTR